VLLPGLQQYTYDLNVPSESIAPRTTLFKAYIRSVGEDMHIIRDLPTSTELVSFKGPLSIDGIKPQEVNLGLEAMLLLSVSWSLLASQTLLTWSSVTRRFDALSSDEASPTPINARAVDSKKAATHSSSKRLTIIEQHH
jgi:hypothetical protein